MVSFPGHKFLDRKFRLNPSCIYAVESLQASRSKRFYTNYNVQCYLPDWVSMFARFRSGTVQWLGLFIASRIHTNATWNTKEYDYLRPTNENGCVSRIDEVNASMTYVLVLSTIGIKKNTWHAFIILFKNSKSVQIFLELYAVKSYHYLKCCKIFCMNTVIKSNSHKIRMLRMNI